VQDLGAALGHRERKKLLTRQALIDGAMRLYRERGFEGVTIAAIAAEARVAPRTFFGYFECKEDVFLDAGDDRLQRLVETIKARAPGEPILAAARRGLQHGPKPSRARARPDRPDPAELMQHPSISARLRERWNRWEDILADAIAREVGAKPGDTEPRMVAAAITAAIRIAAEAAWKEPTGRGRIATRVFDLLASGLADYGA
jgi:AcrR family transcriptional regulator